jgi:hypothetical protein
VIGTWIDSRWRGHKLDDKGRERAITALGAHWAELGFEHFKDGVWVLDLSATAFERRMGDLLAAFR